MIPDYKLNITNDYNGVSTMRIESTFVPHSFWVLDKLIYVASMKSSDILPVVNIVSSINVLGNPYWLQIESQMVATFLPFELTDFIKNNIEAYTRGLKIDNVLDNPEIV